LPGDNRGEAPTTCSLRLFNGLALDFRLQGGPSASGLELTSPTKVKVTSYSLARSYSPSGMVQKQVTAQG